MASERSPNVADVGDAGEEGEHLEMCTPLAYPAPEDLDERYVRVLLGRLVAASYREPYLFNMHVMGRADVHRLLGDVRKVLAAEETLVDVVTPHEGQVHVFGDVHGDVHSLVEAMALIGLPNENNVLVVAGDCCDRGSWGVEVFLYFFVLKMWRPNNVFLLRGNHETTGATCRYGFQSEVKQKLGPKSFTVFMSSLRELTCAALVRTLPHDHNAAAGAAAPADAPPGNKRTPSASPPRRSRNRRNSSNSPSDSPWYAALPLPGERRIMVCHGGLYRAWSIKTRGSCKLGCLDDLAKARRQVDDPMYSIIEDVLWSDPQCTSPDVTKNDLRGAGILYGRGAVEAFFKANHVHGLIRGHEGPDMREKRPEMNDMLGGYSIDIELVDGFVATVFTAADYPLDNPRGNKGCFATLRGRATSKLQYLPDFTQFEVRHRPTNYQLFYNPNTCNRPATPRN